MESVTVAIASIGRPTLAETLRSLAAVIPVEGKFLSVLVADDSPDGAAARLIDKIALSSLPVTCVAVASGNISSARNALLDGASGEWIVFVDDDEWVDPDWLKRLFACQSAFNADVVVGPVHPVYPPLTPDWIVRANPYYKQWGSRGQRLSTGSTSNTLARMSFIRRHGLRFDPAFGRTGGEDTIFFSKAAALGAVIVATDDAIAREHVPADRLEPSYIIRRRVRSGQSYANSRKSAKPSLLWRLTFGANAAAKCAVAGLLAAILRPLDRARSFRMQQKLALNFGKLRAVFDLPLAELYAAPQSNSAP